MRTGESVAKHDLHVTHAIDHCDSYLETIGSAFGERRAGGFQSGIGFQGFDVEGAAFFGEHRISHDKNGY